MGYPKPMLSTSSSSSIISSRAFIVIQNLQFEVCLGAFHSVTVSKCELRHPSFKAFQTYNIRCFASKKRGFGTEPEKKKSSNSKLQKESISVVSETSKLVSRTPKSRTQQAPEITAGDVRKVGNVVLDRQFLEKVDAVKRSARELKKSEVEKNTLAIDYDAPVESEKNTKGLGTKVGVGVAVVVFGLVFALGDFVPSVRTGPTGDSAIESKLTDDEKVSLKERLRQYEATLGNSPGDPTAVEGAAVTLAELGEYEKASSLLQQLTKERPNDTEAYRLLGEVKFEQKDFEGSASAYKSALSIADGNNFEILRGLTNSLLAAKKPSEAVQVLLKSREQLNNSNPTNSSEMVQNKQKVDPIQVELLLGKAYSDWGHVSDAVAVYDQLISKFPEDFRGYLAKGIILKANGKTGDAERMFIQAKFFAPDKAKTLVDRYSR